MVDEIFHAIEEHDVTCHVRRPNRARHADRGRDKAQAGSSIVLS
mgnify:CR=1 FL=1